MDGKGVGAGRGLEVDVVEPVELGRRPAIDGPGTFAVRDKYSGPSPASGVIVDVDFARTPEGINRDLIVDRLGLARLDG